jgi:hypothetical protein
MSQIQPLSDLQVTEKLQRYGIFVKFIPYENLRYVSEIDDIIPCLLLYQLHYPVGHWTVIFRDTKNGKINYFDPIGKKPDQLLETNFGHPSGREKMGADFTYLLNLLSNCDEQIVYNEYPLQLPSDNTCGYWCFLRLLTMNLTNDEFNNCWKKFTPIERERKIVKVYELL